MLCSEDMWVNLALPIRGSSLFDRIHEGLPISFLEQLATLVNIDMRVLSISVGISPSMLSRRVKAGRFTKAESDRLYSLTKILHAANDLFEGDTKAVSRWMTTPVRGLGFKAPLAMLGTRVETEALLDLMGRLEHGVSV
ncbi:antitoxin [Pseudomonas umsongensis]|nr:antitoxin [Pseudomonas umsongensis]